jgi:hypothetical protein
MTQRTGGCLCGAVRYTISGEPLAMVVCHCTHCQRQSGAMFSTNLVASEGQYQQSGETSVFPDRGDSGGAVLRHFCGACGSPILSRAETVPGMVLLKVGTLDDISGLTPTLEVWADHAAAWVAPIAGARRVGQGSV